MLNDTLNMSAAIDTKKAADVGEKAKALKLNHTTNEMWFAGFNAHDILFKRLVYEKMRDLGYELGMEGVEAAAIHPQMGSVESQIEGEVGSALRGEEDTV